MRVQKSDTSYVGFEVSYRRVSSFNHLSLILSYFQTKFKFRFVFLGAIKYLLSAFETIWDIMRQSTIE